MARKIAVSSVKGGCGKTSACHNMAAGLGREGYKVLVIDLDSNPCLTRHMYDGKFEKTIADVFDAVISDAEPIKVEDIVLHTSEQNVDLVPGSTKMAITEIKLPGVMGCDFIMKEAVEELEDQYDFLFFDCPGNTSKLTANALVAADTVLIPIEATDDSLEVIKNMKSIIKGVKRENPKLELEGFLLNKVNRRVRISKANVAKIRSLTDEVFLTEIPNSCRPSEAADQYVSVFEYKEAGIVADAYKELTKEFLDAIIKPPEDKKVIGLSI